MRRLSRPSRNVLWGFGAFLAACTCLFYSPLQFIRALESKTPPMDWWHKMRRVWVSVSARVKPRKPGVAGGETGVRDDASGLLKLRDDVEMCAYNDVQVMWNMLSKCPPSRPEAADRSSSKHSTLQSQMQQQVTVVCSVN